MHRYDNPSLVLANAKGATSGEIGWRCPSNIAIIKYWGKHGLQLPSNPSLSFTLDNAHTETRIVFSPKTAPSEEVQIRFFFDDQPKPGFHPKIVKFIERIKQVYPFLLELNLEIHSHNSFPHSAGIASSASGMGALALCFASMEKMLFDPQALRSDAFLKKASYLARLGSGSACRSVFPQASVWGKHEEAPGSDDYFGVPFADQLHQIFTTFHDDILIVSKSEKEVSSTLGHALMDTHFFAEKRFEQARKNLNDLLPALKVGDVKRFGEIAETEALSLHALMMTSEPSFILMAPNSLEAINRIRTYRKESGLPIYFTLDAGPNIHLLYPQDIQKEVQVFKEERLAGLCEEGKILNDQVGQGPTKLQ